jgi:hypothetical protein
MTNPPGGILTPSQREFLRGINLEEKSNSASSMTRSRIIERIQVSYIEDVPLIASSISLDNGVNMLHPDKISEVENREDLLEGLTLQVALVAELAKAIDADPDEVVQNGLDRELISERDRILKKAFENPEDLSLREVKMLDGDAAQKLQDTIEESIQEMNNITAESSQERKQHDESSISEERAEEIAEDLPDQNNED